jgi:signal peptidase
VCLALALLCLAGLATARVTGHVVLADRSDSMRPAIAAGDLLLVRSVRAATVRRGDVVTFSDPTRDGASITHRVVSGRARDGRIDFVTRGDANAAVERWSIDGADRVGRLAVVIPRAGHVADALAGRDARLFGVALVALLGALYIRRIWSEP